MNGGLQQIWDDIQADIRAKTSPEEDPMFILSGDVAAILESTLTQIDSIYPAVPPMPEGFEWVTAPGAPTFGVGTITETSSSIINDGVNYTVPGATLSEPYAATDMHRLDYVAVNLDTITDPEILGPTYVIIQGTEVAETATFAAPTLPVNHAFVRSVIVTDSGAINAPVDTAIKAISVNGEAEQTPDAAGKVNLVVDANTIPYTPADLVWWEPVVDGTTVILKEGLDYLQTELKDVETNKADKVLTINTQTANYILALTDGAGMVRMNLGASNTLTVPPNSSVAFPVGTQIICSQAGSGQTTIVPGSGVTINSNGGRMKTAGQYAAFTLIKVATDTWLISGDLVI